MDGRKTRRVYRPATPRRGWGRSQVCARTSVLQLNHPIPHGGHMLIFTLKQLKIQDRYVPLVNLQWLFREICVSRRIWTDVVLPGSRGASDRPREIAADASPINHGFGKYEALPTTIVVSRLRFPVGRIRCSRPCRPT